MSEVTAKAQRFTPRASAVPIRRAISSAAAEEKILYYIRAGRGGGTRVYKGPAKTSSIIIVISSDPNDFYTISLAKSNSRERIVFKFRLTSVNLLYVELHKIDI